MRTRVSETEVPTEEPATRAAHDSFYSLWRETHSLNARNEREAQLWSYRDRTSFALDPVSPQRLTSLEETTIGPPAASSVTERKLTPEIEGRRLRVLSRRDSESVGESRAKTWVIL